MSWREGRTATFTEPGAHNPAEIVFPQPKDRAFVLSICGWAYRHKNSPRRGRLRDQRQGANGAAFRYVHPRQYDRAGPYDYMTAKMNRCFFH